MTPDNCNWRGLFASSSGRGERQRFRALLKRGEEFLILPEQNRAARHGLELYPAQTWLARTARALLGGCLRLGLAPGAQAVELLVDPVSPFVSFATRAGGGRWLAPAILAGNPAASGRRFIVLLFDAAGTPQTVIKAGLTPDAQALIAREADFLDGIRGLGRGIPAVTARLTAPGVQAFATAFVAGAAPFAAGSANVAAVLAPWLDLSTNLPVAGLDCWRRLAAAGTPEFEQLNARCGSRLVHPAVYHGDFAPWNLKVGKDGTWHILDWERGERRGPPGWDWFHLVTQPLLLVSRAPAHQSARRIEALLADAGFQAYAHAAGFGEFARDWYLAGLFYSRDVLRQTEGRRQLDALAGELARRWRDEA